jgi:hypothetical protein
MFAVYACSTAFAWWARRDRRAQAVGRSPSSVGRIGPAPYHQEGRQGAREQEGHTVLRQRVRRRDQTVLVSSTACADASPRVPGPRPTCPAKLHRRGVLLARARGVRTVILDGAWRIGRPSKRMLRASVTAVLAWRSESVKGGAHKQVSLSLLIQRNEYSQRRLCNNAY